MTTLEQFRKYLVNQVENDLVEEPVIPALPTEVYEDGIELVAVVNGTEYRFYYNCYFITDYGTALLQFELID